MKYYWWFSSFMSLALCSVYHDGSADLEVTNDVRWLLVSLFFGIVGCSQWIVDSIREEKNK